MKAPDNEKGKTEDDELRLAIELRKERVITSRHCKDEKSGKKRLIDEPHKKLGISRSKCFMNLLRKSVCAVLANQGFIMREILVSNGENIAVIMTLPESIIKNEAEGLKISKEVEFGMADMVSLEPVDHKGRPFRMSTYLHNEFMWMSEYVKQTLKPGVLSEIDPEKELEVKMLRRNIVKLLRNESNLKKLIRIAGGMWTEPPDQNHENIHEPAQIDFEAWRQYEKYLLELAVHIKSIDHLAQKARYITKSYYGNSRFVTRGNYSRKFIDDVEISRLVCRLSKRAFKKCLSKYDKLLNIWDIMDTEPLKYSFPYHTVNNTMRPNTKKFYERVYSDNYYTYPHNKFEFAKLNGNDTKKFGEEEKLHKSSMQFRDKDDEEITPDIYYYSFSKPDRLKVSFALVDLSDIDI